MIHVFIGTKAQLIKMAPIMKALQDRGVSYNFIHSGQHHETIKDIIEDFEIREPDFHIASGSDIKVKAQVPKWLMNCEKKTRKHSACWAGRQKGDKDIVLVHGDTLSTIVGALAAKRMGFKCAHVESGLRSFNLFHPFPEELIRIATFRLADTLYCPDEKAMSNVSSLSKKKLNTHGNTMVDATRIAVRASTQQTGSNYGIASIHRYENIFNIDRLNWIVNSLVQISKERKVIFIMHPPTEQRLVETGLYEKLNAENGIELRKRLGYFDFSKLLAEASFLITDGGSNQEESSYLGLPCLVMRKSTERGEGVGSNVVLADYSEKIVEDFFHNLEMYRRPSSLGEVSPSEIIIDDLEEFY